MYKIYAIKGSTETLIYNDSTPELTQSKLIDPKLTLQDNSAGSLSFKIPQGNNIYSTIEPMTTTIRVTRDDNWMWTGRVLTIKKDFWLQKEITTEGALSFLNDTALPQRKWTNVTTANFVQQLLDIHNSHVSASRKIYAGAISTSTESGTPIGLRDYVSDGESPLKHISTLAEDWGLHMRIREVTSSGERKLYLDLLTDSQLPTSSQEIDFGKNLLDYVDEDDWTDLVTVIHPFGKELESHTITGDEEHPDKLTIKGETPSDTTTFGVYNNEYLYNKTAVSKFGRIEETVDWSEVDDPATLMKLAELYLSDFKYSDIKLTIKVIDLHYMTSSIQGFMFLSKVMCVSKPHNLSDEFIIDKMDIPLANPDNTQFSFSRSTMGFYTSDRPTQGFGKGTMSGMSVNTTTFTRGEVLSSAKRNAAQMILANTSGYVSLNMDQTGDHVENLTIRNRATEDSSTQEWLWSLGGLMHRHRNSTNVDWSTPDVAITMDGQIVANMITTGVLQVASSGGGVLFSADMTNDTVHIAGFTVKGTALYTNDKTTLSSLNNGTYLGIDGVSTANGSSYISMTNGTIQGGINGITATISMASGSASSGNLKLRCESIELMANHIFPHTYSETDLYAAAYNGSLSLRNATSLYIRNGFVMYAEYDNSGDSGIIQL